MLSRVAENLFWMGRYLERSEHLARFLNVQYFGTIDVPYPQIREKALITILDMVGILPDQAVPIEEDIIVSVALNENNPLSILNSVYIGRENARSVRDSISTEVWEAVNNYYLFVSSYPVDVYKTRGLNDFTSIAINHCAIVRGRIHQTLLHDVAYDFLQLGIHLERAIQVVRVVRSKMEDIRFLDTLKLGKSLELQQLNILLDCLEAKDMCRKYYNSLPSSQKTLEFLLFVTNFPRSMIYNLHHAHIHLKNIGRNNENIRDAIDFKVGKIINYFRYLEVKDLDGDFISFLEKTLDKIYIICNLVHDEYFRS